MTQRPLNEQLRELSGLANERGLTDAAEWLQRLTGRVIVFRPGEGESARFDPVEEIFLRDLRLQKSERESNSNNDQLLALGSRSASGPSKRLLREGCEMLVREWRELGELGLSAKVAAEQLQLLLIAVGED